MITRIPPSRVLPLKLTFAASVLFLGAVACSGSPETSDAEELSEVSSKWTWPSIPDGGTSGSSVVIVRSCGDRDLLTLGGSTFSVAGATCGGAIPKWKMHHANLLVALLQAKISIDKTTLLAGTPITLSSAAAARDREYKVRGLLEQINADSESKTNLDTVVNKLSATAAPVMFTGVELTRCGGALQTVVGGGTVKLDLRWMSPYASPPTNGGNSTLNAAATKIITAFAAPDNDYITCGASSHNDRSYFDPTTSPDGFASPAASGSCSTYSTTAISADAYDSRFASPGCNPDTGQNCVACNLQDAGTSCTSRVVWRRVGSSSAWRCRAI